MWNTFKYTTLSIVRERSIVVWVLLFPLILATLFNAMFKGIDENAHDLDPIPVAIVNKSEGGADKAFQTMMDMLSEGDEALLAPGGLDGAERRRTGCGDLRGQAPPL